MAEHNGYIITTDKSRMDVPAIHKWLSEKSYWCPHVPFETVKTSFDNSFCIGVLQSGVQVGFARLLTDYSVFGYLADVFIVEEHRNKGLAKAMLGELFGLDWVKRLRGVKLQTKDGHALYRHFGFTSCKYPERIMERT